MAVGVSREEGGLWMLTILYPSTSMHSHSIVDLSGDWSTRVQLSLLWTNVARPCFLLKVEPARVKFGIISRSTLV